MLPTTERIVHAATEDDLLLEGAVFRPAEREPAPLAVVWVHGHASRYGSVAPVLIARALAQRGHLVVVGNNRGHDVGTMVRRTGSGAVLAGGAWELIEESPRDIAAWIDVAAAEGRDRVVLVGHSLGAHKVAYYQGTRQDPRTAGLVACSPPVRAHRVGPDLVAQAERMVAEGRGRDLLPWGSVPAGAGTISAQTCLSWVRASIDAYGVDAADPPIGRVSCPVLALYGTEEAAIGGSADLDMIRRNAAASPGVTTHLVEGADHVYTGRESQVAELIAAWVEGLDR